MLEGNLFVAPRSNISSKRCLSSLCALYVSIVFPFQLFVFQFEFSSSLYPLFVGFYLSYTVLFIIFHLALDGFGLHVFELLTSVCDHSSLRYFIVNFINVKIS